MGRKICCTVKLIAKDSGLQMNEFSETGYINRANSEEDAVASDTEGPGEVDLSDVREAFNIMESEV